MNIIQTSDGRSFIVSEILKNSDPTSELVKKIKHNRKYDAIVKNGNNVLLCNEILNADFHMISDTSEKTPNISNIKIETDDKFENIGNNVDVKI